jgi:hypothetical protein
MSKLKRRLKRAVKKAAPLLAVAGLGKAFMNARNRKAMLEGADANAGFREMFTRPNMRDIAGSMPKLNIGDRKRGMMNARELGMDLSEYDESQPFGFGLMAKKGGRIVKGKKTAVRKFGKKKKQANKMRKK